MRDSGILHALLRLRSFDDVLAHPVAGASFEGLAIEALIAAAPDGARAYFYRTQVGAEIDLVLELSSQRRLAIDIKSSSAPKATRGFRTACEDISPVQKMLVYPGPRRLFRGGWRRSPPAHRGDQSRRANGDMIETKS